MAKATAAQLIRIARLRQFVGVFARGGDRAATAEALTVLARASHEGGMPADALKRARQAAEILSDEDSGEAGIRALLHLSAVCLHLQDVDAASSASEIARERAEALDEPLRSELLGCAMLLIGIARANANDVETARACLDEAREHLVAAHHPEGAALALVQQGLLDAENDRIEGAKICFGFARDFYRSSGQTAEAAEVGALAARTLVEVGVDATIWFREAIAEADRAELTLLGAELLVELAAELERGGLRREAVEAAEDGARRCARIDPTLARQVVLHARMLLVRVVDDPVQALHHLDAAFELALDRHDPETLGAVMDVVVSGIVDHRFTEVGWRLVDRFRERLINAGFAQLAETAEVALADLRT